MPRHGPSGPGLVVDLTVLTYQLGLMILKVFSSLNYSDFMKGA